MLVARHRLLRNPDDGPGTQGAVYPVGRLWALPPIVSSQTMRSRAGNTSIYGNSTSAANTDARGLAAMLLHCLSSLVSTINPGSFSKCWRLILVARPSGLAPFLCLTALSWSASFKRRPQCSRIGRLWHAGSVRETRALFNPLLKMSLGNNCDWVKAFRPRRQASGNNRVQTPLKEPLAADLCIAASLPTGVKSSVTP